MKENQTIIISGPTAIGKTSVAVELCKQINGSIISADSRQVYKYLDIGTNKDGVLKNDIRYIGNIEQYLTDIIEPNKKFDVKSFEIFAEQYEKQLLSENKSPVIVGGTGLYIKAFLYGLDDLPYADENLRKEIETVIEKKGLDFIYKELLKADEIRTKKNKGNRQRLIRAYEVYKLTGKTMSQLLNVKYKKEKIFKHFVLLEDRDKIYNKINERCKKMLSCGMIEETQKVLKMGYDKTSYGLTGIGYRQIVEYLDGKITKEQMIESFSKDTRQYAKRQITWFKNQPDITIIDVSNKNISLIADEIFRYINS